MVCRTVGGAHRQHLLSFFSPGELPEDHMGYRAERTEMMQGAVCRNVEFPSCWMMSQSKYYFNILMCISFPLS